MHSDSDLRRRIQAEMTETYSINLEKNFDLAKRFVRLAPDGTVVILIKDSLTRKQQILLYLVGKIYSKEAGYVTDESVGNDELLEQLQLPVGSLFPFLKELRDENLIRQVKRDNSVHHALPPSKLADVLNSIDERLIDTGKTGKIPKTMTRGTAETSVVLGKLRDELIPAGYFNQPRSTHEVRSELESRFATRFLSRKVSQALGKLHSRGTLARIGAKGDFRYVAQIQR